MPVSETGSDQGWAEWVEVIERYHVGVRARAARGDNAQPGELRLVDATLRGNQGGRRSTEEQESDESNEASHV